MTTKWFLEITNLYYKCTGGPCIVVPFLVQTLLELLWIRQKSMDSFYKVELGNQCGRELASKKAHVSIHTTWYLLSMQCLTRVYIFQHNTVQMSYKWHLHTIVVLVEYALPLKLSDRAEFAFLKHICNLLVQEVLLGGMQI